MPILTLKPGHVQPIWAGHPWVYAQAVQRIEGGAVAGDEIAVVDPRGNFMGRGFYSPGKDRVNGVVSNMPEFREAFACKVGQPMVREPACRVW